MAAWFELSPVPVQFVVSAAPLPHLSLHVSDNPMDSSRGLRNVGALISGAPCVFYSLRA